MMMMNEPTFRADLLAGSAFGRAALKKMGDVPSNFRIYDAGWSEEGSAVMEVKGAEFRKTGKRYGDVYKLVPGTGKTVTVSRSEHMGVTDDS